MTQLTIKEDGVIEITGLEELLARIIKRLIVTIANQLSIGESRTN